MYRNFLLVTFVSGLGSQGRIFVCQLCKMCVYMAVLIRREWIREGVCIKSFAYTWSKFALYLKENPFFSFNVYFEKYKIILI